MTNIDNKTTLENAQPTLQDIMNAIKQGQQQHFKGEHITLDGLFAEWIGNKKKLAPNTRHKYEYLYRVHVKPTLGSLMLTEVTTAVISELVDTKQHGDRPLATSVIKEIVSCVLSQALKYAEGLKYIDKNPAQFVELPTVQQDHGRALTDTEIKAMRAEARKDRLYIALEILLLAGLRKGELLGLTWDDIDFENGEIRINKAWVCIKGKGVLMPPKTAKSNRLVVIDAELVSILKHYRQTEGKDRVYVISQKRSDKRIDPNNFERTFNKWRDRAGVSKDIHIHCTRHTYCTMYSEAGVDNHIIAEQVGHTDTRMLEHVYLHKRTSTAQKKAALQFKAYRASIGA